MRLLTFSDVARRLGISEPTARKFRDQLPGAVRLSKRTRWIEDEIDQFIRRGGLQALDGTVGHAA